ncbi:hypothetical protein D3C71_1495070 [compost metagenome]
MASLMPENSPLPMRSAMYGELSITSTAGTSFSCRPGIRRCEITPARFRLRSISSWWCASSGKKLMTRSMAWLALLACRVDRHRWPVSA